MKIYSWNINGLRAVLNKGALQDFLKTENPDFICLQEIKCKPEQLDFDFEILGYKIFWNPAEKSGYAGTAILVRENLLEQVTLCALDTSELAKNEGRIIALEMPDFFLVNVYVPNSKPDLSRLSLRFEDWDPSFLQLLKQLEKTKPVITCGDFNAAHEPLDIARPNSNHHSAGFTDEERKGVTNLISSGFVDTFRSKYPDVARYTWWSHWGHARENNVGWRIDYFFISQNIAKNLKNAEIYEHYLGSDHCPISIEMEF